MSCQTTSQVFIGLFEVSSSIFGNNAFRYRAIWIEWGRSWTLQQDPHPESWEGELRILNDLRGWEKTRCSFVGTLLVSMEMFSFLKWGTESTIRERSGNEIVTVKWSVSRWYHTAGDLSVCSRPLNGQSNTRIFSSISIPDSWEKSMHALHGGVMVISRRKSPQRNDIVCNMFPKSHTFTFSTSIRETCWSHVTCLLPASTTRLVRRRDPRDETKSTTAMRGPEISKFSSDTRKSGNGVIGSGKRSYKGQESLRVRLSRARGARGRNSWKLPTWIGEMLRVRRLLRSEILSNKHVGMIKHCAIRRCCTSWDHSEKSQMKFWSTIEAVVSGIEDGSVLRSSIVWRFGERKRGR